MMNPMMNPSFAAQHQPQKAQSLDINWVLANRNEFNKFTDERKKKTLGSILYPLIEKEVKNENLTPKVTGMLIDLDVLTPDEIIETITNPVELKERIKEAVDLIRGDERDI